MSLLHILPSVFNGERGLLSPGRLHCGESQTWMSRRPVGLQRPQGDTALEVSDPRNDISHCICLSRLASSPILQKKKLEVRTERLAHFSTECLGCAPTHFTVGGQGMPKVPGGQVFCPPTGQSVLMLAVMMMKGLR